MTKSKTKSITSPVQPVRKGAVYCSEFCGHGCKRKDYLLAKKMASAMVDELGPGWVPETNENMGWHARATFPAFGDNIRMSVSWGGVRSSKKQAYSCIINATRSVVGSGPTASSAYKAAHDALMVFATKMQRDVEALPPLRRSVRKSNKAVQ